MKANREFTVRYTVIKTPHDKIGLHLKYRISRPEVSNVFEAGQAVLMEAAQKWPKAHDIVIRGIEWTNALELEYGRKI